MLLSMSEKKRCKEEKAQWEKGIPVADESFYAHMLHIQGRVEAAQEFGEKAGSQGVCACK